MSNFLYFQDMHFSGKNSIHHISDYFEDCLSMLDEILAIAKKYKVQAIIDGGDLLHSSEPSYRILDEIADRVEKNEIIMYSLFGNHASKYHSIEHSRYTGLAHLFKRSDYFRYFDHKYLKHGVQRGFSIQGIEYSNNVEEDIKKNGIMFDEKFKDVWKIAIVHAFVTPKPFLKEVCHVTCNDIKTNADIILVAHYHHEWEKKVDNTLFKDIGCIGRRSITERDIKPSILIINTEKREMKELFLKSAKKSEEIFDLSKVEEMKEDKHNMDAFIKSIEDVKFQEMSIKDTVKFLAKEKKFTKKPVDLILNKIGELE